MIPPPSFGWLALRAFTEAVHNYIGYVNFKCDSLLGDLENQHAKICRDKKAPQGMVISMSPKIKM